MTDFERDLRREGRALGVHGTWTLDGMGNECSILWPTGTERSGAYACRVFHNREEAIRWAVRSQEYLDHTPA